jgi:hypothetical protein
VKSTSKAFLTILAITASSLPFAAKAGPLTTTNATQLSVTVAPISVGGSLLGGYVSSSGSGLTAGTSPVLDAVGALSGGATITAALGTNFAYSVEARTADAALPGASAVVTAAAPATRSYGSQTGKMTSAAAVSATLAISDVMGATVTVGTGEGATATAIRSVSMANGNTDNVTRRIASSTNDQATFTSERQASQFSASGSGLTAVTAGGLFGTTAAGTAPTVVALAGGAEQAGVAFTRANAVRTGQSGVAIAASTSTVTQPAYGTSTNTMGGISGGAIATTGFNNMTVIGGGAGTTSTLSLVQSMTAF